MKELLNQLLKDDRIDSDTFDELLKSFSSVENKLNILEKTNLSFETQVKTLNEQIDSANSSGDDTLVKELEQTKKELMGIKKENIINNVLDNFDLAVPKGLIFDAFTNKIADDADSETISQTVSEYLNEHPELQKAKGQSGSGAMPTYTQQLLGDR